MFLSTSSLIVGDFWIAIANMFETHQGKFIIQLSSYYQKTIDNEFNYVLAKFVDAKLEDKGWWYTVPTMESMKNEIDGRLHVSTHSSTVRRARVNSGAHVA